MTAAALCLVIGALVVELPVQSFTLAWQHSVEKVLWEEDYVVAGEWLFISGARIRGSGAGMEPPGDAVLSEGVWHYRPADRWRRELQLARSQFSPDYELCVAGRCRPLADYGAMPVGTTHLRPCAAGTAH